jgi:hypothetical protein
MAPELRRKIGPEHRVACALIDLPVLISAEAIQNAAMWPEDSVDRVVRHWPLP